MNKQEKQLLWGLAAIGILALLARNSAKKNENEKEPRIEGLPNGFRKVGEITPEIAKIMNESKLLSFKAKPGPIITTELFYQHIKKEHTEEKKFHSYRELDLYVKNVINNYNQIWTGSDDSILLVTDGISKHNKHIYEIVALQMFETIDDGGKACWNVHTAQSRERQSNNRITIWKK